MQTVTSATEKPVQAAERAKYAKPRRKRRLSGRPRLELMALRIEPETLARVRLLRRMCPGRAGNSALRDALRVAVENALGKKLSDGILASQSPVPPPVTKSK